MLEKGEQKNDDEILKLQMESETPLDALLKEYNIDESYFNSRTINQQEGMEVVEEEEKEGGDELSNLEEEGDDSDDEEEMSGESDEEYSFPDDSQEELDDEETIEAEERIDLAAAKQSAAEELAALEADNQIPIEELLSSFKSADQIAVSDTLADDTAKDANEKNAGKSGAAAAANTEAAAPQDDKVLNTIAATAQSLQPTGYTLETTKVKTVIPSQLLKHTLREYQHVGLDWLVTMYENKLNGILADEMGLGKTIQTIALLAHLACEKGIWGPHLIVVPTSVMLNWELEFKKWCPGFKILTYYGNPKERRLKRQVIIFK